MNRIEQIKNMWGEECKIYGPMKDKYENEHLIAQVVRKNEVDLYLYETYTTRKYICCLFARWMADDTLMIDDIQIAEDDCNCGLGSIVLEHFLEYAISNKATRVGGMLSWVDKDHFDRSEAFYKKHGFIVEFSSDGNRGHVYKNLMEEKEIMNTTEQVVVTEKDNLLIEKQEVPEQSERLATYGQLLRK